MTQVGLNKAGTWEKLPTSLTRCLHHVVVRAHLCLISFSIVYANHALNRGPPVWRLSKVTAFECIHDGVVVKDVLVCNQWRYVDLLGCQEFDALGIRVSIPENALEFHLAARCIKKRASG